jgi:hypothetical protein
MTADEKTVPAQGDLFHFCLKGIMYPHTLITKSAILWDVTELYRRFRGTYCLHLQVRTMLINLTAQITQASCFLCILQTWRWVQYVSPKRWTYPRIHDVASRRVIFSISTSNPSPIAIRHFCYSCQIISHLSHPALANNVIRQRRKRHATLTLISWLVITWQSTVTRQLFKLLLQGVWDAPPEYGRNLMISRTSVQRCPPRKDIGWQSRIGQVRWQFYVLLSLLTFARHADMYFARCKLATALFDVLEFG